MTRQHIFSIIASQVADAICAEFSTITEESTLKGDLHMDSLDVTELVYLIEQRFDAPIVVSPATVGDLVTAVYKEINDDNK